MHDQLQTLSSSNEEALRTTATERLISQQLVEGLISHHETSSSALHGVMDQAEEFMAQINNRADEISALERELEEYEPLELEHSWSHQQDQLSAIHRRIQEASSRIMSHENQTPITEPLVAPMDELDSSEDEMDHEEQREMLTAKVQELNQRIAVLVCDKRELSAVHKYQRKNMDLMTKQLGGVRSVLWALHRTVQRRLEQTPEDGPIKEAVHKVLEALPTLDSLNAIRRDSTTQTEANLEPVATQTDPVRPGWGQLLLCQERRSRQGTWLRRLVWWWRCQQRVAWAVEDVRATLVPEADHQEKTRLKDLEKDLRQSRNEARMYQQEYDRVKAEFHEYTRSASKGHGAEARMMEARERAANQARTLQGRIQELELKLQETKEDASAERHALHQQATTSVAKLKTAKGEMAELRAQLDDAKMKIRKHKDRATSARTAMTDNISELTGEGRQARVELMRELKNAKMQVVSASTLANERLRKVSSLEHRLGKAKAELEETRSELSESTEKQHALEAKAEVACLDSAAAHKGMEDAVEQARKATQEKIKLNKTCMEMKVELEKRATDIRRTRDSFNRAVAVDKNLREQLEQERERMADLKIEIEALRSTSTDKLNVGRSSNAKSLVAVLAAHKCLTQSNISHGIGNAIKEMFYNHNLYVRQQAAEIQAGPSPVVPFCVAPADATRVLFCLARWTKLEEAAAVSQWKGAAIQARVADSRNIEATWRHSFQTSRHAIQKLQQEKAVLGMRSSTLTSILCATQADTGNASVEIEEMSRLQLQAKTDLDSATKELERLRAHHFRGLVVTIKLWGSRPLLRGVKTWIFNMRPPAQVQVTPSVVSMLRLLKGKHHEVLARITADSAYHQEVSVVTSRKLDLKSRDLKASRQSQAQVEVSVLRAMASTARQTVRYVEKLQSKIAELKEANQFKTDELQALSSTHSRSEDEVEKLRRDVDELIFRGSELNEAVKVKLAAEARRIVTLKLELSAQITKAQKYEADIEALKKHLNGERTRADRLAQIVSDFGAEFQSRPLELLNQTLNTAIREVCKLRAMNAPWHDGDSRNSAHELIGTLVELRFAARKNEDMTVMLKEAKEQEEILRSQGNEQEAMIMGQQVGRMTLTVGRRLLGHLICLLYTSPSPRDS
eukprot:TRINITY_DN5505_c0_g1_i1.p1 TRINITY_DN5505_c0_g1~~TRINITY_DN5505_c0_g1_i1.p1  ORF type:complete len:1137 (+),score=278.31 TRINITY_DN5505_c0_g1_i1:259-3669(+)